MFHHIRVDIYYLTTQYSLYFTFNNIYLRNNYHSVIDYYFWLTTLSKYLNFQVFSYTLNYLVEINLSRIIFMSYLIKNYTDFHSIGSAFNLK